MKVLLAAHFLALVAAAWAALPAPGPIDVFPLSLVFADSGLLGLWGGLAPVPPRKKAFFFGLGMAGLVAAINGMQGSRMSVGAHIMVLSLIWVPASVVFVALNMLRRGKTALQLARSWPGSASTEGLQFSMRHLLVAITTVCIVLSSGKVIRSWSLGSGDGIEMVMAVAVFSACLIFVELATFWGALGIGRPLPRLLVVSTTAFAVGLIPPFYLMATASFRAYSYFSCMTGFQCLITAATLLVFRSCGWRLSRGTGEEQPASDDEANNDLICLPHSSSCNLESGTP